MVSNFAALAVGWALTGVAFAAPADEALVKKVYDLKPILGEKGKSSAVADTDAVIKTILDALPEFREVKAGAGRPQLVERDGGKLEVHATPKAHAELKDLLEALERLADVAVDVKVEVIELDRASFEKLNKAIPGVAKGKTPVLLATGEEIEEEAPDAEVWKALKEVSKKLTAGREVQSSAARLPNGLESTVSSRLSVLTFHQNVVNRRPSGPPDFVKEGFKLVGMPVVSADRRFVRFKLTEQSTAVSGVRKVDHGEVVEGQKLVVQSPELEDLGATGSAVVADGGTLLFRLAYAPKDKVWVVVVKPTIFIRAEEEALKKEQKK